MCMEYMLGYITCTLFPCISIAKQCKLTSVYIALNQLKGKGTSYNTLFNKCVLHQQRGHCHLITCRKESKAKGYPI